MRILIDIGHPAHVHYFRNFVKIMSHKGHSILLIARDKEITQYLLNKYNIIYYSRGKGSKNIFGKLFYMLKADYIILRASRKFKPDLFLSAGSIYASHASFFYRKPHIALEDTEHSINQYRLYSPFTDIVLTPSCFTKDLGKKQIRFNSFMELCYLHPNYFTPDPSVLKILGVNKNEKYIIMRFVSWNASHDAGHSGLSLTMKRKAVKELSQYAKVLISSEGELPEDLKKYQIKIPPERMHEALFFATLFVGEGATMSSECAVLGTTAIYVNSLTAGTLEEQETYGLLFGFRNSVGILEKALELLNTTNLKQEWQKRRQKMLEDKIDVTSFLVWFVENYPESANIMKKNPVEIENKFHGVNPQ